ncbi:hypothetical protein BaRGS_00028433, partial [Batillaria attramentaria]
IVRKSHRGLCNMDMACFSARRQEGINERCQGDSVVSFIVYLWGALGCQLVTLNRGDNNSLPAGPAPLYTKWLCYGTTLLQDFPTRMVPLRNTDAVTQSRFAAVTRGAFDESTPLSVQAEALDVSNLGHYALFDKAARAITAILVIGRPISIGHVPPSEGIDIHKHWKSPRRQDGGLSPAFQQPLTPAPSSDTPTHTRTIRHHNPCRAQTDQGEILIIATVDVSPPCDRVQICACHFSVYSRQHLCQPNADD